jgi:ketosteroid isomerase-like protein
MAAEENRATIRRFYGALDRHDGEAMAGCYAPEVTFEDPAFGELHGDEARAMWKMLTGRTEDLSVELRSHDADDAGGTAKWVATYTFGPSGRKVVNDIQARFRFDANGKIADHRDDFDLGRWARQALGPAGIAVSLLPPMRSRLRARARRQLDDYMASRTD